MALQIRRGNETDRMSITPLLGEPIYVQDQNVLYMGDGVSAGGLLPRTFLADSNKSNRLELNWNDDDTADRILYLYMDGANRALSLRGNLTITGNSYINQDVRTTASPTFVDLTLATPSNIYNLLHDSFSGFIADKHIAHSGVSIIAGTALTGGGDITASRTLNVNEAVINHDNLSGFSADEHHDHTAETVLKFTSDYGDPGVAPNKINLWSSADNNYFGFGISSGSLDYISQSAHNWYCDYDGTPGFKGMTLDVEGNLNVTNRIRCQGFGTSPVTGTYVMMAYHSGGYGQIWAYDYDASQYKPIHIMGDLVILNDGEGSNIDADMVDGLHAAEIAGGANWLVTVGSYGWHFTNDAPKIFNAKVQVGFQRTDDGWPGGFYSVLAVGGYSPSQDGGVMQLLIPYSPDTYACGYKLQYRLGRYNNLGWGGLKTIMTEEDANYLSLSAEGSATYPCFAFNNNPCSASTWLRCRPSAGFLPYAAHTCNIGTTSWPWLQVCADEFAFSNGAKIISI